MASQHQRTVDGQAPGAQRQPWWETAYRWLGWLGGVALLALGFANLKEGFGLDCMRFSLLQLSLALTGLLLVQTWAIEVFEWRRGRRIMAMRRWLIPTLVVATFVLLASGLAWLLGY
jgi:hypothetical protein